MTVLKFVVLLGFGLLSCSAAASSQMTQCTLTYRMQGWSFVYRVYKGSGSVRCRNGERANVTVVSHGVGASLGRSEINQGRGVISDVRNLDEVFGTYVYLDGHAGAAKSVEARTMTKGLVSLALSGLGRGFDLGVTIGAFTIKPR